MRGWWAIRDLPNVHFVHFQDLKTDLAGEIARIADFLGAMPDAATLQRIVDHSTFDYMKAHANEVAPLGGALWDGGGDSFIHKGTNGRWRDILTAEDVAAFEARALAELGQDCADWLANGSQAAQRAAA